MILSIDTIVINRTKKNLRNLSFYYAIHTMGSVYLANVLQKIKSYPKTPNDFASFESHEESNFFTIRVNGRVRVALIPRTSNLYINCPYGQCP